MKWLVTERTPIKRKTNKEKRNRKDITKTSLNFTKDVNINFIEKIPLKIHPNISYEKLQIWLQFTPCNYFCIQFSENRPEYADFDFHGVRSSTCENF